MQLLDKMVVTGEKDGSEKSIELYCGDLAAPVPPDAVADFLVVSAFPDNYLPSRSSLVGALKTTLGVSLHALAERKFLDLRATSSCWVSELVPNAPFKRIVCFEPAQSETAAQVVGDIFRSLVPLINTPTTVCLPVVATGNQKAEPQDVLPALLEAARHWMTVGLPLHRLNIVEHDTHKADRYARIFAAWKLTTLPTLSPPAYQYDVFISYCHANKEEADFLARELQRQKPNVRLFLDRQELNPGAAWQQKVYEALDDCRHIVALLTPDYVASKMCAEEFNIGLLHQKKSRPSMLIPLYIYDAPLKSYQQLVQYIDCREGDKDKMEAACRYVIAQLQKI